MTRVLMAPRFGGWYPADDRSKEELAKIKTPAAYFEVKRARNPRQHRLYWALMDVLWQHQKIYATQEQMSNAIKCAVGWCDELELRSGKLALIPKSIAFANMPQAEFEQFFTKVVELVCARIIPNTDREELRAHLEEMVNTRGRAA